MDSLGTKSSDLENRVENWLKSLEEYRDEGKEVPLDLQSRVLFEMRDCFWANMENRDKGELTGEALERFVENCGSCLGMISDDLLVVDESAPQKRRLPYEVWAVFAGLKYGGREAELREKNRGPCVTLELMEAEQGVWRADCSVDEWVVRRFRFLVTVNGKEISFRKLPGYVGNRFFGKMLVPRSLFRVELPVGELLEDNRIQFAMEDGSSRARLAVMTARYQSRVTRMLKNSYWCFGNYMVTLGRDGGKEPEEILIRRTGRGKRVRQELELLREMVSAPYGSRQIALVRGVYWLTRPVYRRKRIWITFDKLYKGGDCGEYFYKYMWERSQGKSERAGRDGFLCPEETTAGKKITPAYVIKGNAADYDRLRAEGYRPLAYRSLGQRLAYLNASVVFGTHSSVHSFCGFNNWEVLFIQDRMEAVNTCIQHGLSVQDLRFDSNRLVNNNKRYYCASKYEVENLSQSDYGYDPEVLRLTGIPRYDGLSDRGKRQILIAPTWRAYLAMPSVMGEARPYSPEFKNTEYYRIFQELLDQEELRRTAVETGYRVIFLLHPVISAQKRDFHAGEGVELLSAPEVNYERLLTEASLMVTDYSGVQFDFAYMRKPVVYFHPPKLPPHYVEGGFDYETQGFGEICRETEELVRTLCGYMRADCGLKPLYRKRQDDFFAFDDQENCRRIYEDAQRL